MPLTLNRALCCSTVKSKDRSAPFFSSSVCCGVTDRVCLSSKQSQKQIGFLIHLAAAQQQLRDWALQEMSKALLLHVSTLPTDSVQIQRIRPMNVVPRNEQCLKTIHTEENRDVNPCPRADLILILLEWDFICFAAAVSGTIERKLYFALFHILMDTAASTLDSFHTHHYQSDFRMILFWSDDPWRSDLFSAPWHSHKYTKAVEKKCNGIICFKDDS